MAEEEVSHKENDLALKNINEVPLNQGMGKVILLVEKTNKNPDKLFQMFQQDNEIMLKKLRSSIGKTSLYRLFSFRVDEINAALKNVNDSLFFLERKFCRKNSKMIITYSMHPDCMIGESDSFFWLEFKPIPPQTEITPQRPL